MTVQVYEKNGRYLPLHLPIGIIRTELGSRLLARLILRAVQQKPQPGGEEKESAVSEKGGSWPRWLDERALCQLLRALGCCLKQYRGLTLAEAESADGDFVRIIL